ncbi:phage holin family protein [Actinopolymorpha sp. NPDC004070]|uniref:phage holin family protein n=1 Tax=Actinopolymorpha sp. NPDC004070 TaxID=3154548 RepID=UPI00339F4A84
MSGTDPFSPTDSYSSADTPGTTTGGGRPSDNRSLGEIVGAIAGDLTTLVRAELDLAKTELKREATHAGKGAGLLGGAGVGGLLALVFVSLALMFLLDNWMPIGLAALIVGAIWGIVAAVLAARGKTELKQPMPPLEATQRTLKEDVQWAKAQKGS